MPKSNMNYSLRVNCNWILCEIKFEMRNEIDNQKQKSETEMLCIKEIHENQHQTITFRFTLNLSPEINLKKD